MISISENKVHIIRLDKGEEIIDSINKYCQENDIVSAMVKGIGAASDIVMGYFNVDEKKYYKKEFSGNYEITSLTGNISLMDKEVYIHLHIAISDKDCNVFGGHLNSACITGTGEIYLLENSIDTDRKFSTEIGLNLFEF